MRVHDASASVEQQRMNEILEANRDASVFARRIGFSEIQLILLIQNVFLYLLTSVVNLFFAHNLIDLHKVGLSNGLADVCTAHYNSMYQLREWSQWCAQSCQKARRVSKTNMSDAEIIYPPLNFKSKVWEHYGFYKKDGRLDKTDAICKMCRASVKKKKKRAVRLIWYLTWSGATVLLWKRLPVPQHPLPLNLCKTYFHSWKVKSQFLLCNGKPSFCWKSAKIFFSIYCTYTFCLSWKYLNNMCHAMCSKMALYCKPSLGLWEKSQFVKKYWFYLVNK